MRASVRIRELRVTPSSSVPGLLDAAETAHAERLADPGGYRTAHTLARLALAEELGADPGTLRFVRRCATCGGQDHGKPTLRHTPELAFSLTYTPYAAMLAVADARVVGEVGIDLEQVAKADFPGFDLVALAAPEIADRGVEATSGEVGETTGHRTGRAVLWARKEALLKATGFGLAVNPAHLVLTGAHEAPALVSWLAPQARPRAVTLRDLHVGVADHVAAVAVLTSEPITVAHVPPPRLPGRP